MSASDLISPADAKCCILIFGGPSAEHRVSCISAASIHRSLSGIGYRMIAVGVSLDGRMFLQKPRMGFDKGAQALALLLEERNEDLLAVQPGIGLVHRGREIDRGIIFPIIHGGFGEDGRLQGMLDLLPYPYIGCGAFSSALGFSKYAAKLFWSAAGLPVVPFLHFGPTDTRRLGRKSFREELAHRCEESFRYPVFVKPESSGSSIGVSQAYSREELLKAFDAAAEHDESILVEQAVHGRELECGIVGTLNACTVSPPGEISTPGHFYSYEYKYLGSKTSARITVPAEVSDELAGRARELARKAFVTLRCSGLARVDMLYQSSSDVLYLNEINTLPGFTDTSMFIQLMKGSGIDWPQLMPLLESAAMERRLAASGCRCVYG